MNTQILLDHEPVAGGGWLVRALLRVTGAAPPAADRPRLNLAVVLDRSGSMGGPKLTYAKEAASLVTRRLGDDDVISLVVYDDDVTTLAGPSPGARRRELAAAIRGVVTGGCTNLSGGWLRGRELVESGVPAPVGAGGDAPGSSHPAASAAGVHRVLLLTDGLANVGITDPGTLRDLVATAAATRGITTTTIGFGEDYDEALLRSLAEAGGGNTHYIETADQAPAIFDAELQGLLALAAQNVAVTVAPAPAARLTAVHHAYPSRTGDDGSLHLELGDLYALEPRSLLVEFLVGDIDGAEVDVATLTLEGYVLLPGGGVERKTVALPIRVSTAHGPAVEPELRRELLLLEAARARDAALEDRTRGGFADGARRLRHVADKLAPHAADDDELRDELQDLRHLAERYDAEQVSAADAKWMYQRSYSTTRSKRAMLERLREDRSRRREP